MASQLPDRLVDDITDFFLLDILKEEDRIELCQGAYLTTDRWLLQHLKFSGTPRQFIVHTLNIFIQHGTHLAEPFFLRMRARYGDREEVTRHLAEFQAATAGLVPALRVGGHLAAGHPEAPALYLVHSDGDSALAQQVVSALQQHGRSCRLGPSLQKGSDRWLADVGAALSQAYGVVCLVGRQTAQDRWVQVELLAAQDKRKPLVALYLPDTNLPPALLGSISLFPLPASGLLPVGLLNALPPQPGQPTASAEVASLSPALITRAAELRYMDSLRLAELHYVGQYTRLGGQTQLTRSRGDRLRLNPVVARTEFHHAPWRQEADQPETSPPQPFEDAVTELQAIRRAVLLGDPGSGKTTTLYKLAADLIDTALLDRSAPIPLLVRLGQWTEAAEPLPDFLQRSLGEVAEGLAERLAQGRAALLLDGINEIPAGQHADKFQKVGDFLAQYPHLMAIVTCREQDYPPERALALDRVTVAPLDPVRIHEFVCSYLNHDEKVSDGVDRGDDLFWKLAGEKAAQTYHRFNEAVGASLADSFATFWLDRSLPDGLPWDYSWNKNKHWEEWLKARAHPASLLLLATNPYMLFMLVDVYQAYKQTLPANRGQLFDWFVETLLVREQLFSRQPDSGTIIQRPEGKRLLQSLTMLAAEMQRLKGQPESTLQVGDYAVTTLPAATVNSLMDANQVYHAASANLLLLGEEVRFTHQLLQEYFLARYMRQRIFEGDGLLIDLLPEAIWHIPTWWQPTNWEEATILLAGLYSDDCTPVLDWLADAQPELAARCIMESGAYTPDETKLRLRDLWLPRLTNLKRDPDARARAAVGRALGRLSLADGTPLDNRPGVGVVVHKGIQIPEIAWGETVPAGGYTIGGDKDAFQSLDEKLVQIEQPFRLARFPVTYAQFHCFITASDVMDPRWWRSMPLKEEADGILYQLKDWSEQTFKFWNHPREMISWYQAVAFCRWLSDKLEYAVELPHEHEWEVAARYPDSRLYPWGEKFDLGNTNINLFQTSAVGIYPQGRNEVLGLEEMSGNTWEWCCNEYPPEFLVDRERRVSRGGSWRSGTRLVRAASRDNPLPAVRGSAIGFRVVHRDPLRHEC